MSKHFNELTPAEAERIAYLIEEAAEVQQIACKILRHGYSSANPDALYKGCNRTQLFAELRDLAGAIARMTQAGDLQSNPMAGADPNKGARYMHHQDQTQTLVAACRETMKE